MTLFDYYLQYMTQEWEGKRPAPEGITLPEDGDEAARIQTLGRQLQAMGMAAFVRACAAQDGTVLPVRLWLPLAVFGILLAPAKLVYLPLAALFLLIPNSRFGQSAATKKAAYLAGCVLLALSINRAVLVTSVAGSAGFENQTTQTETTSAQGSTPAAAVSYTATEAADNRTLKTRLPTLCAACITAWRA